MKNDNDMLFDDNESQNDLFLNEMTQEEIDRLYDEIFGKPAQQ